MRSDTGSLRVGYERQRHMKTNVAASDGEERGYSSRNIIEMTVLYAIMMGELGGSRRRIGGSVTLGAGVKTELYIKGRARAGDQHLSFGVRVAIR
jgi:hypothetical protein